MNSSQEDLILGLPRRPRVGDASAGAILGALALGLLTGGWGPALLGGLAGSALANQRQPLEMAIRDYFKKHYNFDVAFVYPAPRAVKVTFLYRPNAYWTVESVMPDDLRLPTPDDNADWLYGNLIKVELPRVLPRLRRAG